MSKQIELTKAGNRVTAAERIYAGRMSDFAAGLLVATDAERARLRDEVHASLDGLLDAQEAQMWIALEAHGINPMKRG